MTWLRLARRTALVTGAGSGIGLAISRALVLEGCNVILADVDATAAAACAEALTEERESSSSSAAAAAAIPRVPGRAVAAGCDVTDPVQVRRAVAMADELAERALEDLGGGSGDAPPPPPVASILVNCAGITRDALLPRMSVEDFDAVVGVNLRGTWLTCRHFCSQERLELLAEHRGALASVPATTSASIVNVASVVARTGNFGQTNYGASKAGVVGLTRSLAKEMAGRGVRANAILPGFIDTPMSKAVPERIREGIRAKVPMGAFGRPKDVADLALFLSSCDRSGYITGESIECSGMIAL